MPIPILVVEDDASILNTLTDLLTDEGYTVHRATHGRNAWELLSAGRIQPALIILDLNLPLMSGKDLYARIQSEPRLAAIPILVLSAASGLAEQLRDMPIDALIAKPFDLELLLTVVARLAGAEAG